MGQDCKDRLATLPLSDEDRKNPQIIVEKLAEHFAPARNVLYDRYVFHSASQQQNESVDQYVVRLRQLGKACKFGALEEEMIRDRLVLGCKDKQAQARLFREQLYTVLILFSCYNNIFHTKSILSFLLLLLYYHDGYQHSIFP